MVSLSPMVGRNQPKSMVMVRLPSCVADVATSIGTEVACVQSDLVFALPATSPRASHPAPKIGEGGWQSRDQRPRHAIGDHLGCARLRRWRMGCVKWRRRRNTSLIWQGLLL